MAPFQTHSATVTVRDLALFPSQLSSLGTTSALARRRGRSLAGAPAPTPPVAPNRRGPRIAGRPEPPTGPSGRSESDSRPQ